MIKGDMPPLERVIAEQQEKIDVLERQLAKKEREDENRLRGDAHTWREAVEADLPGDLPVPRVEVRWREFESGGWLAQTGLVSRDYHDSDDGEWLFPHSSTSRNGGGKPVGKDTPWRDGILAQALMVEFKLPGYVVIEDANAEAARWATEISLPVPEDMPPALRKRAEGAA